MSAQTVYTQASQLILAGNNSASLNVGNFAELAVDINITSKQGTSPTIQYFIDRLGVDGIWYPIWQSAVQSVSPAQVSPRLEQGLPLANRLGDHSIQVDHRWDIHARMDLFGFFNWEVKTAKHAISA
jgi:hypothetical protein